MSHRYYFDPSTDQARPGVVTVTRPLGPAEADLWETGPMFEVAYANGIQTVETAFLDELTPMGDAPAVPWGEWWDAEDYESSGASQHYIETGERQTRRDSWEHSIHAERAVLAAEAVVRRAVAGVKA